jgi:DNA-binding SARP family transcriptional activator
MIELRVLGALDLRDVTGGEIGRVLAQPKRLALLAYLALTHATQQRESLLALFWPELDEEHARLALRQAVHFLRSALGPEAISSRSAEELAIGRGTLHCDALEFERALDDARLVDALDLYRGDLLPGFHADDIAPELEQWFERERQRLRSRAARAAWALAEEAARGDNHIEAAHWARQAVHFAPDDEAGFRRLVLLLDRLGDRAGALRAYDAFARRLRSEFGVAPAAETRTLIETVRSRETTRSEGSPSGHAPLQPVTPEAHAREQSGGASRSALATIATAARRTSRWRHFSSILAGLALLGAGVATLRARRPIALPPRTIAVGFIQNHGGDSTAETARILPGLLATDLARVRGLSIVSDTRLYEILAQLGATALTPQSFTEAARRAGAVEVIEGVLYRRPGGPLRLDLRRVDVSDGAVRDVYTADGADAFDVADRVTAMIAATFALTPPSTPLTAAASGSIVARRFYEEGLRTFYRGEWRGAYQLFSAALVEDSAFAMAAYYAAKSIRWTDIDAEFALLVKADTLAEWAPERERLTIKYGRHLFDYPVRAAVAESLALRFPHEPDGHLAMATLRLYAGDFVGARTHARRVIAMDSLSLQRNTLVCRACDAFEVLLRSYAASGIDSFSAVERTAREWIQRQPTSYSAWHMLAVALSWRGRHDDASAALQKETQLQPDNMPEVMFTSAVIKGENYTEVERLLRDRLRFDAHDGEALSWLVITLRNQGRIREALSLVRKTAPDSASEGSILRAQTEAHLLFELGRFRDSGRRFEALLRVGPAFPSDPGYAAHRVSWEGVHAATAWTAAGDTQRLQVLADTIERVARLSSSGVDWRLPHHVRGLLWQARGEPARAAEEFRAAIFSPTRGYTRTNLELARALMSLGKPLDAIRILREVLGGSSVGESYYLTRTEVHDGLARAFEAAGQPDSAMVHYRKVAEAWKNGDPPYRVRAEAARRKLQALEQ